MSLLQKAGMASLQQTLNTLCTGEKVAAVVSELVGCGHLHNSVGEWFDLWLIRTA